MISGSNRSASGIFVLAIKNLLHCLRRYAICIGRDDTRFNPLGQFLTAIFELRPSRRKAAAMERVRYDAEDVFWSVIDELRFRAEAVSEILDSKDRKASIRAFQADVTRSTVSLAIKQGLPESVATGLARDVIGSSTSYIELRTKGHAAQWPARVLEQNTNYGNAINRFISCATKADENAARDDIALVSKVPGPRPLVIARSRDATLLRNGPSGEIIVALNIIRASDPRSEQITIKAGVDASTGELTKAERSKTRILVPVSCGKWHEQKFLSGKATLRSSLILRRGDRWFMCAQFEMAEIKTQVMTGARLGVDRGIVNPITTAVVNRAGQVISATKPSGSEIGKAIRSADQKRRAEQRRRGMSGRKHAKQVDHHLHELANGIVRNAKEFGAQVVVENLDGFKSVIRTKRVNGARRNPWQKALKGVQLGKLESILTYKLRLTGIPVPSEVFAARTSINCPADGHTDAKSRVAQDKFVCTSCGFSAHADTVGAVNIARRDIALRQHKKGGNFAALERDMVMRLRVCDDGGLGPLAAGRVAAKGFVAVHASAGMAYDPLLLGLTMPAGQNVTQSIKNGSDPVFAERGGAFLGHNKRGNRSRKQAVTLERLL